MDAQILSHYIIAKLGETACTNTFSLQVLLLQASLLTQPMELLWASLSQFRSLSQMLWSNPALACWTYSYLSSRPTIKLLSLISLSTIHFSIFLKKADLQSISSCVNLRSLSHVCEDVRELLALHRLCKGFQRCLWCLGLLYP